jgi:hypothetical protein
MSRANRVRFELRIEAAIEQYETCLSVFGEDSTHTSFAIGKLSGLLELYHDIYQTHYQGEQHR